jgi:hypothetical protein
MVRAIIRANLLTKEKILYFLQIIKSTVKRAKCGHFALFLLYFQHYQNFTHQIIALVVFFSTFKHLYYCHKLCKAIFSGKFYTCKELSFVYLHGCEHFLPTFPIGKTFVN